MQQVGQEISIVVRPAGDGDDRHDDGPDRVAGGGALFHRPEAVFDGGGIGFELVRDRRRVEGPGEEGMAGVVEVEEIFYIGGFGQNDQAGVRMFGEKGNHDPRVAGEGIEGQAVLEFTEVEGGRLGDFSSGGVDGVEHVGEVEIDFNGGAELDAQRSGQVTVMTAVGTKTVGRKVPVVRAGVVTFIAETDGGFQFAEEESFFAGAMLGEKRVSGDLDFGVGEMGLVDDLGGGVQAADAVDEGKRWICAAGEDEGVGGKTGRDARFVFVGFFEQVGLRQHDTLWFEGHYKIRTSNIQHPTFNIEHKRRRNTNEKICCGSFTVSGLRESDACGGSGGDGGAGGGDFCGGEGRSIGGTGHGQSVADAGGVGGRGSGVFDHLRVGDELGADSANTEDGGIGGGRPGYGRGGKSEEAGFTRGAERGGGGLFTWDGKKRNPSGL